MAHVTFTQNIQRHVSCPAVEVAGATVREVLDTVFAGNHQARSCALDEQGGLRQHIVVFIDGAAVRDRTGLSDAVSTETEVYVFQALSGG